MVCFQDVPLNLNPVLIKSIVFFLNGIDPPRSVIAVLPRGRFASDRLFHLTGVRPQFTPGLRVNFGGFAKAPFGTLRANGAFRKALNYRLC